MENRIFKTLVKEEHGLGKNDYVQGRISGMMSVICDKDKIPFGVKYLPRVGHMLITECTESEYDEFSKRVEKEYPGLCVFASTKFD